MVSRGISRLPSSGDSFVVDFASVSEFLLVGADGGEVDGVMNLMSVLISPSEYLAVEVATGSGWRGMIAMHSPHLMPFTAGVPFTQRLQSWQ